MKYTVNWFSFINDLYALKLFMQALVPHIRYRYFIQAKCCLCNSLNYYADTKSKTVERKTPAAFKGSDNRKPNQ